MSGQTMTALPKTSRKECNKCPALCCRNLSIWIGKPANREEIDDLKWQLHFDTVRVYIRNNRWYQLVEGKCIYLDEHNRCRIYETRPDRCRRHNPPNCEFFGDFFDVMFTTPEDLENYFAARRKK
jgi:Fe-S-cluster containining protein